MIVSSGEKRAHELNQDETAQEVPTKKTKKKKTKKFNDHTWEFVIQVPIKKC